MTFDGNPKNFPFFKSSFNANSASKVTESTLRLTYRIQHGYGEVKKVTRTRVLFQSEIGHDTTMMKLDTRFSQSHLIARSYIDDIIPQC